jgi:acetylornithine/succinyldiaminopimelate/putrescine aminotransferase
MNPREIFFKHLAQTSDSPLALEVIKAEGCMLFESGGKSYLDLVGGISVANVGHRHPKVVAAIKDQLDQYLHVMVYGEFIQSPQVQYAQLLTSNLPRTLNSVFFTNSGAEAVEGAMKLAKRFTGRREIIAFNKSYHGSTQGALSILGDEYWRNAYRPLLPGIIHADYNTTEAITLITEQTACVIIEPVQAEAGIVIADPDWLISIKNRCAETGTLLVFDEIQTGFGRTGELWAFNHFKEVSLVPDILLLGKALGGGMPLGAFIADHKIMTCLTENPVLGHLSTFGGHPVCCAAGMAAMKVLLDENILPLVTAKEKIFQTGISSIACEEIRNYGLWFALEFESFEKNKKIVDECISNSVFTDWFLFNNRSMRISPPLTITNEEIETACGIIRKAVEKS